MRSRLTKALTAATVTFAVAACAAAADGPSPGTYSIKFPSTAAAVATDTVQLLVYDVPRASDERADFCQRLIQARKRKEQPKTVVQNLPVNICEMLAGKKPLTIPYGEKAVLAVAQRKANDFLIGCAIQTFGEGDAPLPIDLALVDVGVAVPDTTCASVGDFCQQKCPAL
jgi:hypothetical protein